MDPQIQALIDAINKLAGGTSPNANLQNPVLNQLISIRVILTAILQKVAGGKGSGFGGGGGGSGGGGGGLFGRLRRHLGAKLARNRYGRHIAGLVSGEAGAAGRAAAGIGEAGAAGSALGAAGIAGGIVIGTLVAITKEMRDIAREQLEESRRLGKVSPSQALITAQLDINRLFRDLQKGERTAATAKDLAEATNRFEKAMLPFENLSSDFKNFISGWVTDKLAVAAEGAKAALTALPGQIGLFFQIALRDAQEGGNTMAEDLNRIFGQEKAKIDDAWKKKDAVRKQQEQDRFRGMPRWAGGR